jgi:hypothetical protein
MERGEWLIEGDKKMTDLRYRLFTVRAADESVTPFKNTRNIAFLN